MYKRSHVNVRLERGSTFTFTRDFPELRLFCLCMYNLRTYARKDKWRVEICLS